MLFVGQASFATVYIESADFIKNSFDETPKIKSIWIKEGQQEAARKILGHSYQGLRVRYWQLGTKTT